MWVLPGIQALILAAWLTEMSNKMPGEAQSVGASELSHWAIPGRSVGVEAEEVGAGALKEWPFSMVLSCLTLASSPICS